MIKVCGGIARKRPNPVHLWVEVYIRLPRSRTLVLMWTRGMWHTAEFSGLSFRDITRSL